MSKSVVVNFIAEAAGFQGEVDKIEGALGKVSKGANGLGLGLAAGMTAVGGAMVKFGEPIEQAEIKLKNAVNNTGGNFEELKGKVGGTVTAMEKFGHGSADTQEALAKLTVRLNDPTKAMADMATVAEVAAFKHISLSDAADLVGKAAQGNAKVMKTFGLEVANNTKLAAENQKAQDAAAKADDNLAKAKQTLVDLLDVQHHKHALTEADHIALRKAQEAVTQATTAQTEATNTATASTDYMAKKMADTADPVKRLGDKLKGVAEDQAQTFHGKIDAIKVKLEDFVGTIGAKVGPALVTFGPALAGLGPLLGMVTSGVGALSGAMAFLAANPVVLIVIAIVAFVAILVVAYEKVGWFRDFVNAAFSLVGSVISGVFNWVKDNWPLLLVIIAGPFGVIADLVIKNFGPIKDFFAGVWSGIVSGAKWAINEVIGVIDGLIHGFNSASSALSIIPGVPKFHIDEIPKLARGGIVNGPTLAMIGEAGPEAVVPLNGQHGMGTTVNVYVSGSVTAAGDLVEMIRQGLQSGGRLNTTALNGFA